MTSVPAEIADEVRGQLERIREMAEFGLSADQATRSDERQWYRTVLGAVGKILAEAQSTERNMSGRADDEKIMTPTEIAEAAGISRAAVFKRRSRK